VDANVKSVVFTPSGSTGTLEKDMDVMLNNVLELFLTEYHLIVSESVTGLVAGPARTAVNSLIGQWIEKHSSQNAACGSTPGEDASPDFVNFNHLKILRQLNGFLDMSLDSMNQYLSCVADTFNRNARPHSFQVANINIELSEMSVESDGCVNHLGE
jgi:hypothetical protein